MATKKTTKKPAGEKKPSLDIKDEMLYADYKVFDWLEQQPEELAKTFSPLVAMKWQSVIQNPNSYDPPGYVSVTSDAAAENILMVNSFVNVGFWEISKHPELLWRLMCAAGSGQPYKHGWIAMAGRKKSVSKLDQVFLQIHPQLSDEELKIFKSKFTVDTLKDLLKGMALSDVEIKPLVEEFKKTNG